MRCSRSIAIGLAAVAAATLPAAAQSQAWIRQFGSSGVADLGYAVAPDGSGGLYVGGDTAGSLGAPSQGGYDAWFARCDGSGNPIWVRQIGVPGDDYLRAAVQDNSGGMYVSGSTQGSLGGPNAGDIDVWIARYGNAGNQTWIRQFGSNGGDYVVKAAKDGSGGLYLVGSTGGSLGGPNAGQSDAWLARYDGAGNQVWVQQIGGAGTDYGVGIAVDGAGGAFVILWTNNSLFLTRYGSSGGQSWIVPIGSGTTMSVGTAPDGVGGVFVGGVTWGSLGGPNQGDADVWLARYDASGNQHWLRQFGTSGRDLLEAAAPDSFGGVYVSGFSDGGLGGANLGGTDAWVARFDSAGNQVWIDRFGTPGNDYVRDAAPDGAGGVFLAGGINGPLGGGPDSLWDAHATRYFGAVSSSYCTSGTTTHGCTASMGGAGTPSASAATGFQLTVSGVEGQKQGMVFYGIDNSGFTPLAWGTSTSYLCVKSPLQRVIAQNSGGTLNACDGLLSLDWNAFRAANPSALGQPFMAGQHVYAQGWFRDPPSPKTTALSNALEFVLQL